MKSQLEKYAALLVSEGVAKRDRIAISCQNDIVSHIGSEDLVKIADLVMQKLDSASVILAEPVFPFPLFLLRRISDSVNLLIPNDSESVSSLHDIPLIRGCLNLEATVERICEALYNRKGCIVEGIGLVSHAAMTTEQAYIAWSSLFHATFIKYFEDLMTIGPLLPEEPDTVARYRDHQLKKTDFDLIINIPKGSNCIMDEMIMTGSKTVRLGLVDSFFGNISFASEKGLFISQTSACLDELEGQIDIVPFDNSTTSGMTASSELPAHQAIVRETGCKAILHGHPRFPIVMSFFANPSGNQSYTLIDTIPVVGGEGGVGGLASTLPTAFRLTGAKAVVVKGHGVFAISDIGFADAFSKLAEIEKRCRDIYFKRLKLNYMI